MACFILDLKKNSQGKYVTTPGNGEWKLEVFPLTLSGYRNGLYRMLSSLASFPHFSIAEATEIESSHGLHPCLETRLRRNIGLSNLLDWETTWTKVSVTACENSFTSSLVCKGGWCLCLIRFCCPSASRLPGEAWSRCSLRRPGCPFLVYCLRMYQGAFNCPTLHTETNLRTLNHSDDVFFPVFLSSAVQNLNDQYQCSESGPCYKARGL